MVTSDMGKSIIRKRILIVGNVTGIGLRRKTVEIGDSIGVSGWISKHKDWRFVTIEVQGTELQLQEFMDNICNLPGIRIKELHEENISIEENDIGFGSCQADISEYEGLVKRNE